MHTGRRSIINVFVTFGIFAILLVTITYLFIFRVMSDERAAQDRLFFKISSSNNILVDIENCRSAITQYRHAWESKYLELYLSSIEKINSDVRIYLSETDSFSYENIQSVRRLSNFLAYQSRFDLSSGGFHPGSRLRPLQPARLSLAAAQRLFKQRQKRMIRRPPFLLPAQRSFNISPSAAFSLLPLPLPDGRGRAEGR